MITIETRIRDKAFFPVLERAASLFSHLEHLLFVALYARGEELNGAKRRFIMEHRITARQFNAVHKQLTAKVESWREMRKLNLETVKRQIDRAKHDVAKVKSKFAAHQKKRRLKLLLDRKNRIEKDLASAIPSICFGSRKQFQAQFNLKANGYADHVAWLKDWRVQRASSFFVLGSSDESCGNQSCQYRDGSLHLRLPNAIVGGQVEIPVAFRYRQYDLLAALVSTPQKFTRGPRKGKTVERCSAVSYRFIRRDRRWFVQAMFDAVAATLTTDKRCGCVGVDLNPWGLAVARVDASGNPADHCDDPWAVAGRTNDQIKASIGDAVRGVVLYAREKGVPIAIEKLDFAAKKCDDRGSRTNRMLSAFAYSSFAQTIRGRCAREGVELIEVNPAYTSVIGKEKFARGYGLSVHRSAACVIARRALHFGEALRTRYTESAFTLPARNRVKHVWSDWSLWAKAHRAQRKADANPKGSRGPEPSIDREITPDPLPPNDLSREGCAGGVTPRINEVLGVSGEIPEINGRRCCSGDLVDKPAQAPPKAA